MGGERRGASSALQTVSRAVALLRCFEEGTRQLSLAELTRLMGLNKVTVFRLASTLQCEGLLTKDPVTGSYAVSSGLLILGRALLNPAGLVTLAQPVVKAAQEATGETVMVNLRDGHHAVVVYEILSTHPVRYSLGVGYRADLRLGAASRAILAFLNDRDVDAILTTAPATLADGRQVGNEEIRAAIAEIRRQGISRSESQRVRDAAGFAAPFFGADGNVKGALAIVSPVSRSRDKAHSQLCIDTVRHAAWDLTGRLGGNRKVG